MGKLRKRVAQFFANVRQYGIDRDNRKLYEEEIAQEIRRPESKFNQLRLNCDGDKNNISWMITIPENYQLTGTDAMIYSKLKEEARPVLKYLSMDLNWGEYFMAPEYYHIEDEEDTDNVSCTYLAVCRYQPVLEKYPQFKWEVAAFIGINSAIIGALVTLLCFLI